MFAKTAVCHISSSAQREGEALLSKLIAVCKNFHIWLKTPNSSSKALGCRFETRKTILPI